VSRLLPMTAILLLLVAAAAQSPEYTPSLQLIWQRLGDLNGEKGSVESAEFSPDGTLIASGSKYDNQVVVWRVADASALWRMTVEEEVECVSFSPDGRYLATGGEDDQLRLWRAGEGKLIKSVPHGASIDGCRWSNSGKLIATGQEEGRVTLWSMPEGKAIASVEHGDTVNSIDFTQDDRLMVTAGDNAQIRLWRTDDLAPVRTLRSPVKQSGQKGVVEFSQVSVRFSPDGRYVASTGYGGYVHLFRVEDGAVVALANQTAVKMEAIEFTRDGRYLVSTGHDARIRIYRVPDLHVVHTTAPVGNGEYLHFDRRGNLLVSAHEDGLLRLWLWQSGDPEVNMREHTQLRVRQAEAAKRRKNAK
jgi:WD40 repeat protein